MAIHAVRQPPHVPGWTVQDTGTNYVAEPITELTSYQLEHGCQKEITGASAKAVEILCVAQIIYTRMCADAEAAEWAEAQARGDDAQ